MIGYRLKERRKELNISQRELAKRAGVSRNYISLLERGKAGNVTLAVAKRLAGVLKVSLDWLAGYDHGGKVLITITRRVWVDAEIAAEVQWLNNQGVYTVASCSGHGKEPGSILIEPGSAGRAERLGYSPRLTERGLFEIVPRGGWYPGSERSER